MKTVRRPTYPKWNPGYFPCSSLTPLPLSSRRPSVSFGGFGLSGQGKCPSRPLSYHRTVIRGTCPWCASWAGSWLRRTCGPCSCGCPTPWRLPEWRGPRRLACCTAFHRTLCRDVGVLRGDAGGLRTLPPPFNVALSASMASRDVDVQRLCQGNGPAIMSVVAVSSQ